MQEKRAHRVLMEHVVDLAPLALALVCVGAIVWFFAAVRVLADERYPESSWRFLAGLVRWEAHLLAYLASLVDDYPPFTFASGSVSPA